MTENKAIDEGNKPLPANDEIKSATEACMLIIGAYEGYEWERARSLEATASQMFEYAKAGYKARTEPQPIAGAVEFTEWVRDNYRQCFDRWAHKDWTQEDYVNKIPLTTKQLYQQFKASTPIAEVNKCIDTAAVKAGVMCGNKREGENCHVCGAEVKDNDEKRKA